MLLRTEILDVQKMQEAERLAMQAGISGATLMENAGMAVAEEIRKRWTARPVAVLCGPGNNGGDGFVIARLLAQSGWKVKLGLLGNPEKLPPDALHHAKLWKGKTEPCSPSVLEGADLIVDALLGTGLKRPLEGAVLELLSYVKRSGVPVVAVDIPSGIMGDTGEYKDTFLAALTVTFCRKKPAHVLLPGRDSCGEIVVADIGISDSIVEQVKPKLFENSPALWNGYWPRPDVQAHKYTRGHALIYGGYPLTGAARLAAQACARIGAGLTTIACPEKALPIYAASFASLLVKPVTSTKDMAGLLDDKRLTAALIGPGAGQGEEVHDFIMQILETAMPVVLDADAITAFEGKPETLKRAIKSPCVMTPHEGEFRKLFNLSGSKLHRACTAAQAIGAVIVLKGSDTVIASADGRAVINTNAPPALATAGSGDVLGGIITGLLAQKMEPFMAAATAVWLHAQAANRFGPGLIADDIPQMLPAVLRSLNE